MLQIRLLGQFDVRLDEKRIVISSRAGQSLLAYLAMTAGTSHRREKLAGILWPNSTDENARRNLRQELWRIRKAILPACPDGTNEYLLSDEYTVTFNPQAGTWLDVAVLERPAADLQSLTSSLSVYQGELLPGFYESWIVHERERIQILFEARMQQVVENLLETECWADVQERCERWLSFGNAPEPAYRALMLSYGARGDMARVSSTYQRCVVDLREQFGVEPSAETLNLYNAYLAQARQWAILHSGTLHQEGHPFLGFPTEQERQHSLEAVYEMAETEKARTEEQANTVKRLQRRNRVISALGSLALLLALLAGLFGWESDQNFVRAESSLKLSEAERLAAEADRLLQTNGDPQLIALLSLRSMNTRYTPQGDEVLSAAARLIHPGRSLRDWTGASNVREASLDRGYILGSRDRTTHLNSVGKNPELPSFNYSRGAVSAVAFSPDGRLILLGGEGGLAQLWDASSGQKLHDLIGHTGSIRYGVAFSPDGQYALTGSWDKSVRLWEVQTGREVRRFTGHTAGVNSVAFSPDGKLIVSASGSEAILWDIATGQELRLFSASAIARVSFSPDGRTIATASRRDGTIRIWEVATGKELRQFVRSNVFTGESVAFSPDGKYLLTSSNDGTAWLWNIQTGRTMRQFSGHTAGIRTASFSSDGKYVVTASGDGTARLWDTRTGKELRRFTGPTAGVENAVFSPDGKYLLTGSDDGTARLWDVDYHTTMRYLCSALPRDLTDAERTQYNITDGTPTCPNHASLQ